MQLEFIETALLSSADQSKAQQMSRRGTFSNEQENQKKVVTIQKVGTQGTQSVASYNTFCGRIHYSGEQKRLAGFGSHLR